MIKFMAEVSKVNDPDTYWKYVDADCVEHAEQLIWSEDDELTIWQVKELECEND